MARFDVYRNPSGSKTHPYLVVVQHELLEVLPTRVVVPLVRPDLLGRQPFTRLNPTCVVEGKAFIVLTQQLGAVSAATLKKPVASLATQGAELIAALDVLFSGV
jgi:toxin CcdB